jgi:phenylpropionate dioxygenase-like ring-hydroxylating dioxygenase large terminal subunit
MAGTRRRARALSCVHHNWRYDLDGNLVTVAFQHGFRKQCGLPADFDLRQHQLRPLRVATLNGLVFATFFEEAVLEMGGRAVEDQESRVSEAGVRGFWQAYRGIMGV